MDGQKQVKHELNLLRTANPDDLNQTYKRLYMEKLNQNERQNTAKTYRLVLSAYEPMKIKEVAEAVSIGNDGHVQSHVNVEYIKRRCQNFVVEDADGYLQFAHHSARLFFKAENQKDKDFVDIDDFSETANHREMAKICLQLMLRPGHPMWLHRQRPLPMTLTKLEEQREYDVFKEWVVRPSFSQYAFFYWVHHCQKLGPTLTLGGELSKDLTRFLFDDRTAFSWWCRVMYGLGTTWATKVDKLRDNLREKRNQKDALFYMLKMGSEISTCMKSNNSAAPDFSPLLAVCTWNFAECLKQPRALHFLKHNEWPSRPQTPLHACCKFSSIQTFSELVKHYPEKVMDLIDQKGLPDENIKSHPMIVRDENIPLHSAVISGNVEMTKRLLAFEQTQSTHQGRWSSRQLSSLGSLSGIILASNPDNALLMLPILFAFEASQTGDHFPPRPPKSWTSTLAQQGDQDWHHPLIHAARYATAPIVSLLLQAGARSPPDENPSALSKALRRQDKEGPPIVTMLFVQGSAVCGRAANDDWVAFLGREASKREVLRLLSKRPQLARLRSSKGETALVVARRSTIRLGEDDEVHVRTRREVLAMMERIEREAVGQGSGSGAPTE
jgi:ankyrin repeat protein